jgi:DNA mismatch endonuclease (patch repair protein)
MDTLSAEQRSERMSRVRGKDTKPELVVRRLVHKMGYRYRKHRQDVPGCPDLAFIQRRKAIFVHGCFWHRHACSMGRLPKSRHDFWISKLEGNRARDKRNLKRLRAKGWQALVVWECETRDLALLTPRIRNFLDA